MSVNWEVKKISEFSTIKYGYTAKSSFEFNGPKYLRITDIQNNNVDWALVPNCVISDDEISKYKLKEGDIVFARTGATTGKSYLINEVKNSVFASYLIRVQIIDESILSKYLYLFFQSESYWLQIQSGISGSAQGGVNAKKLGDMSLPIPSINEQKQIVKILDNSFEAIEKAKTNIEKNLQNTKELFASKLNEIFSQKDEGWEEKTFNEVLEIRSGRNQKDVLDENGIYPILGSAGKIMGYANNYICEEDTTIIGRKGTINNPMIIKEKFWNVDTAFGLHAKESLDKRYLFYFCLSFDFSKLDKGSGRPSLVKSDLLKIKLPFNENKDIQKSLVKKLDNLTQQTKQLEQKYQQKLNNLEELKKSILQKAFSGELLK